MPAKKPAKKSPAKRKPRAKKPVDISAEFGEITTEDLSRLTAELRKKKSGEAPGDWKRYLTIAAASLVMLGIGATGGWWSAGGIQIGPGRDDVLSRAYDADRVTQIAVLRELADQPFDGKTDDGRKQAGEWFNAQRFRNRAEDFGGFTDALAEAISENKVEEFANTLKAK